MRKRIFYSIWLMSLILVLLSTGCIIATFYNHFTQEQFEQLRNETDLAARGMMLNGIRYLEELDTNDFRAAWIASDGTILFDNESGSSETENYLERKEIQDAINTGYGESSHYSDFFHEHQLYTAALLPDNTILCLSITQASIWTLFMNFLPMILCIIVITMALSFYLASRISHHIVKPLNTLDLNDPLTNNTYKTYSEIQPLLTRLDQQHKQIERDKAEIEKTAMIRQEFTANASHELKTPLHVISGYAELLESGMTEEADIPRFAGMIRAESQRMAKLVEDIIDLSSLDSGAIGVEREMTDLHRIAASAVQNLQSSAETAGVTLSYEGESALLYGIPHVLYSIVYNLTINAIHYTESGGRADVRVKNDFSDIILTVQDNGIGIPKEDLNRIFERFYRVDKSHSKEVGGTGLGLSIVKHAAQTHNAEITAESELGKGSLFTIRFHKTP